MTFKASPNDLPIEWCDIISIDNDNHFSDNVSNPEIYISRVENFLDEFQKTDFGQDVFLNIRQKYGEKKLEISLNDDFGSMTFPSGNISISIQDECDLSFIDQDSNEFQKMPLERILVHELIHASDPRVEIGKDNKEECHKILVEEYATSQTDKYSRLHKPEFGQRVAYDNIIPKNEQDTSISTLVNNPEIRKKIRTAVTNVQLEIASCTDTIKDFNGTELPISLKIELEPVEEIRLKLNKVNLDDAIEGNKSILIKN